MADGQVVDGLTNEAASVRQPDFPQFGLEGPVVHDHIHEVGHVGLSGQTGHSGAGNLVRVDGTVSTHLEHFGHGLRVVGPRHDEQAGVHLPGRESYVEVVDAGPQGRHQGGRPVDAGTAQDVVAGGIPSHVEDVLVGQAGLVAVDHHHLLANRTDELGDGLAYPSRTTHDEVAGQVVDGTLHAIPPKLAAKTALNDAFDYRRGAVEHRAGTQQDEHRGERLPGGVRVTVGDLPESHCADGDNGLVGGIDRAQPKERVADRTGHQDADD